MSCDLRAVLTMNVEKGRGLQFKLIFHDNKIKLAEESVKEEIVSSADKANDEKEITTAEDPETELEERQEAVSKRSLDYDHDDSHFEETKRLRVREE